MGKNLLVGVGGKARKVKALYVGVGGKARKVKKVYVGVGGKARLVYMSNPVVNIQALKNNSGNNYLKLPCTITNAYYTKFYVNFASGFSYSEPCVGYKTNSSYTINNPNDRYLSTVFSGAVGKYDVYYKDFGIYVESTPSTYAQIGIDMTDAAGTSTWATIIIRVDSSKTLTARYILY